MAECEEALPHLPIVYACDDLQRDLNIMVMQLTDPPRLRSNWIGVHDLDSWTLVSPLAQGQDPNDLISSFKVCHQVFARIYDPLPCNWLVDDSDTERFGVPPTRKDEVLEAIARLETVDATDHESNSANPRQAARAGAVALASFSRRGRGQRRNKAYWKTFFEHGEPQNPFERDCLFGSEDSPLTTPATSYMDSTSTIPRCMSMKYLHELGLESHLSTAFEDPGLLSIGMGGQKAKVTGIVRDIAFRLKGASTTFRGDFYVSELLDGFYDILFGWQFMSNEAADILEKAHKVYQDAKAFIGNAASKLTAKIGNVISQTQRRVSDFVSGVSLPPPPYSLVNILEGDYVVAPRVL